jgi:hypothetical protein
MRCPHLYVQSINTSPDPPPSLPPPQAYSDDELAANTTILESDAKRLGFNFWEKRTMTNDFATVVHRMKSLGEWLCGCVLTQ